MLANFGYIKRRKSKFNTSVPTLFFAVCNFIFFVQRFEFKRV